MATSPSTVARARSRGLPTRFALVGDERLARLVAGGSEKAFAALYERYHQPLYRYCRSILRDQADAEDALQSTFASALAALQRGRREAPMRPWLFRIAHNEAISLVRRRRHDATELADDPGERALSAADQAAERERLALLVEDLQALPERQRGALVMRELSGLSHAEIALALGVSVGAAKQTIFDARASLAEFAQGRAMACEDVRRSISDGDGRTLRGRRVRAHLRDCAACRAFASAIPARSADLHALAPAMAPVAATAILAHLVGAGSARGVGGLGGSAGGGAVAAGKLAGAGIVTKALLGAAIVASTATVAGVVLHPPRHPRQPPQRHAAPAGSSPKAAGRAVGAAPRPLGGEHRGSHRSATGAPPQSEAGGRGFSAHARSSIGPGVRSSSSHALSRRASSPSRAHGGGQRARGPVRRRSRPNATRSSGRGQARAPASPGAGGQASQGAASGAEHTRVSPLRRSAGSSARPVPVGST